MTRGLEPIVPFKATQMQESEGEMCLAEVAYAPKTTAPIAIPEEDQINNSSLLASSNAENGAHFNPLKQS